jgi:hypothetical protein
MTRRPTLWTALDRADQLFRWLSKRTIWNRPTTILNTLLFHIGIVITCDLSTIINGTRITKPSCCQCPTHNTLRFCFQLKRGQILKWRGPISTELTGTLRQSDQSIPVIWKYYLLFSSLRSCQCFLVYILQFVSTLCDVNNRWWW